MQTFNDLIIREWQKLVEEETAERVGYVVSGMPVVDFSDYKYRIGLIAGLEKAKELFDIAQSNVEKRT